MIEPRTGNRLSTDSSEAAGLYREAIDLILGSESATSIAPIEPTAKYPSNHRDADGE